MWVSDVLLIAAELREEANVHHPAKGEAQSESQRSTASEKRDKQVKLTTDASQESESTTSLKHHLNVGDSSVGNVEVQSNEDVEGDFEEEEQEDEDDVCSEGSDEVDQDDHGPPDEIDSDSGIVVDRVAENGGLGSATTLREGSGKRLRERTLREWQQFRQWGREGTAGRKVQQMVQDAERHPDSDKVWAKYGER